MSAIGTTAATNHLLLRPQSKYGLVHLIGPGMSSAPSAQKNIIITEVIQHFLNKIVINIDFKKY